MKGDLPAVDLPPQLARRVQHAQVGLEHRHAIAETVGLIEIVGAKEDSGRISRGGAPVRAPSVEVLIVL